LKNNYLLKKNIEKKAFLNNVLKVFVKLIKILLNQYKKYMDRWNKLIMQLLKNIYRIKEKTDLNIKKDN
jgi:hypothetical protein